MVWAMVIMYALTMHYTVRVRRARLVFEGYRERRENRS